MMETPYNLIMLTGAGFSKNFGGFLAREMWQMMFNHPLTAKNQAIRDSLLETQDFEQSYSDILESSLEDSVKADMNTIVSDAYKNLDVSVRVHPLMRVDTCNTYSLNEDFLNFFTHRKDGKQGMFFTLNQDLLMERHQGWWSNWPGISKQQIRSEPYRVHDITPGQIIVLDSNITKEAIYEELKNGDFGYFKLHGSFGWTSSDGKNQLVVGKNKTGLIEKEPLLRAYLEIFEETLKSGNKKLWIMGYGFGDTHINKIIAEAIRDYGLSIYVVTTSSIDAIKKNLGTEYAAIVMKGMKAYYQYRLGEIYPFDQHIQTVHKTDILTKILDK